MSYKRSRVFTLCVASALAAGCATWNPFARETSGPEADSQGREPYYTAEAGVKLYLEPRFTSSSIAELPLHQKVYRTTLDHGFAYVEVVGSGQKGWVDNGKLIWRLPAAAPVKASSAPARSDDTKPADLAAKPAADAPATDAPAAPAEAPAETVAEQAPAGDRPAVEDSAPEESDGADPSLFSPF